MTADQRPIAPHPTLETFYPADEKRQPFVNDLFDRAARSYDWINTVMSFGSGYWYRGEVLREAGLREGMSLLDVATGTGPVAAAARRIVGRSGRVVGVDPSAGMLREARRSQGRAGAFLIQGTGESLPITNERFDFLSMGYALRHVPDLLATFREYRRVLKPGGRLVIMEIGLPQSRLARGFVRFYMGTLLPLVARLRGGDAEQMMRYYWETTNCCVPPEKILGALQVSGFHKTWSTFRYGMLREYHAVR